jgi:hypothetical protein
MHRRLGIAVVALGSDPADTVAGSAAAAPPSSSLPSAAGPASWIAIVGRMVTAGDRRAVRLDGREVPIEWLCRSAAPNLRGSVAVTGVGTGDPARILVPCGGIRPAPVLTRPASRPMTANPAIGPSEPTTAERPASGGWADRRAPAAALLAAGLVLLGMAAALRSRIGNDREPRPEGALEPDAASVGGPPQLTLVHVPDERGS